MGAFWKYLDYWTVIRVALIYFFFMLFFWGSKSKLGTKEIHEDYNSLETMKSLRGFAAIGVILHHISQQTLPKNQSWSFLSPFVNAGAFFVAIFFFCSGYGLLKSLDTKDNYLKGFIPKRIFKGILIPFYVDILLYGFSYLIYGKKMPVAQWICNLTGLTQMNIYAWFPIVLAILYFVFYIVFKIIKSKKLRPLAFLIIAAAIIGIGLGFCYNGHFAWWAYKQKNWWNLPNFKNDKWWVAEKILWFNGEWWVNSMIGFLAGLLFANYEEKIVAACKKYYAVIFHVLLALTYVAYRLSNYGQEKFGYWTEMWMRGPRIADKIKTYFCQLPVFFLLGFLIIVFMMKYHVSNPVTRFFGNFSLHTYLMNLLALEIVRLLCFQSGNAMKWRSYLKFGNANRIVFVLMVLALTIVLGVIEYYITEGVKRLIFPKKKTPSKPENMEKDEPKASETDSVPAENTAVSAE